MVSFESLLVFAWMHELPVRKFVVISHILGSHDSEKTTLSSIELPIPGDYGRQPSYWEPHGREMRLRCALP